jgi:hypothetical protein
VAFDKDPSTVPLGPVARHPCRVYARRYNVVTRDPDVTVSIPPVITADPDISMVRRRARMFYHDRGRGNADNDLRKRRRSSKRTSKNSNERDFLHG